MKYDFESVVDRTDGAAFKYAEMNMLYPDLPKGTIPFSMADMEFPNPPEIMDSIRRLTDTYTLGYANTTDSYREACCSWQHRRRGWEVSPEWLVPVPGVLPGLFALMQEFTAPGDGIIYFSPVFGWFNGGAALNGRVGIPCSLVEKDRKYHIDFEEFERLAKEPSNTAVVICNPHNPTSQVWSEDELKRIADISMENDLLIISDEVHSDIVMPGFRSVPMGTLGDKYLKNMVICIAPSKTFNMAGLQSANLVVPDPVKREAVERRLRANGIFVLTAPAYRATEAAYNECGEWLDQCIDRVWENHLFLKKYIKENIPEIVVYDMEATYLQWLNFGALAKTHEELREKLHRAGVIMDQGPDFGKEGDLFERMNLACPEYVLRDALERMKNVFHA